MSCEDYYPDEPWKMSKSTEDPRRRYFETIRPNGILPQRGTRGAAGYDLYASEKAMIAPSDIIRVRTGVRVKMPAGEVLIASVRSSLAARGLILANGIGVIDSDYFGNEANGGEIILLLCNIGSHSIFISEGDRIAQGIFMPYFLADDDNTTTTRVGGIGSTG